MAAVLDRYKEIRLAKTMPGYRIPKTPKSAEKDSSSQGKRGKAVGNSDEEDPKRPRRSPRLNRNSDREGDDRSKSPQRSAGASRTSRK